MNCGDSRYLVTWCHCEAAVDPEYGDNVPAGCVMPLNRYELVKKILKLQNSVTTDIFSFVFV